MGKIGNVLTMLKILENGQKYTVKELAERLEVSKFCKWDNKVTPHKETKK